MTSADDLTSQTTQLPERNVADETPQTSAMARASFGVGLVSVFFCVLIVVPELFLVTILFCVLTGIPALILGICALISSKRSQGRLGGRALAWAGVAMGIINIVVLIGAYFKVREIENSMRSQVNLKQLGLAMDVYNNAHEGLPPAYIATKHGDPGLSWRVLLLPYVGEDALYREFHLDEPWDSPHNIQLLDRMPDIYRSPNDPKGTADTPYRVFVGEDVVFSAKPRELRSCGQYVIRDLPDGASNTILIAESTRKVLWTKPEELEYADDKPLPELGYLRKDRFIAVMADGSVRTIDKKDEANIRKMIKPNDGKK